MEPESSKDGGPPECVISEVANILTNMFGLVMDNDAILSVVECCDGDLQQSIDALMQITKDAEETTKSETQNLPEINPFPVTTVTTSNNKQMGDTSTDQLTPAPANAPNPMPPPHSQSQFMNYSNASRGTGVVPKQPKTTQHPPAATNFKDSDKLWMDQLTRIIQWHYKGFRIMVIMRGAPGSGKSYLSRKIIDATVGHGDLNYRKHVQSTDDFFINKGKYIYVQENLSDAHTWNQNRVQKSLINGLSPVIIDNTNIHIWEMHPYVKFGVKEGYYIEIIDPISPWAKNVFMLFKKNSHNVPLYRIKKMLENYQANVSAEVLIKGLDLMYPSNKCPPVLRQLPLLVLEKCPTISYTNINRKGIENTKTVIAPSSLRVEITSESAKMVVCKDLRPGPQTTTEDAIEASPIPQGLKQIATSTDATTSLNTQPVDETESTTTSKNSSSIELAQVLQKYNEVEQKLREFDELDAQWEMGDDWNQPGLTKKPDKNALNPTAVEYQPTLDRFEVKQSTGSMELQPSLDPINNPGSPKEQRSPRRFREPWFPEASDWEDWRDVTRFMPKWNPVIPSTSRQTPEKLEIEKRSSGTCVDVGDTEIINSKYKVFTGSPKDINFYYMPQEEKIPDKRMLDKSSMTNDQAMVNNYRCKNEEKHFSAFRKMFKNIARADLRDIFDKCCGDVNWAVEIVIDGVSTNAIETIEEEDVSDSEELCQEQCGCLAAYNIVPNIATQNEEETKATAKPTEPVLVQKKVKKEKSVSESMQKLKKLIEQNVVIADNHYSQHCLKIRKMRRGENEEGESSNIPTPSDEHGPSTSTADRTNIVPYYYNSDDDSESSQEYEETTVNVNLGREFVTQLDDLCNRQGMQYATNIVPHISMPLSTLHELNALWIESLSHQIEMQATYSDILMKEDEEFARQLAEKEAELEQEGREPEVPDFKDIMDLDFAVSLYQKDVAEWRSNEPNDIAARMTRQKLYNLFPDVLPDVLSEMLMAHDNNFKATVEVLLMSTGQSNILEEKNGINKFVMEKEISRQEKILEEENKNISEEQFPVLLKAEKVDMSVVEKYRKEAQLHLERRNYYHQKAQMYIQRGITPCAVHASGVAALHKRKFEQANCRAATSLIQVNTANRDNNHLDLHYLYVTEALTALDIFLDHHVEKLRDARTNTGNTLFIITGRGLHSSGGARIKPAVRRHLRARGLKTGEKNPGLVTTVVRPDSLLTHEFDA